VSDYNAQTELPYAELSEIEQGAPDSDTDECESCLYRDFRGWEFPCSRCHVCTGGPRLYYRGRFVIRED
jgi:hypothetical protein